MTCRNFRKTYEPKECWTERVEKAKSSFPGMGDKAAAALANDWSLWEQQETGMGFCHYHEIKDQIPNHMSCDNYTEL